MSYIKAKYPCFVRPFMKTEIQGYGSGKSQNSATVSNSDTEHVIDEDRASSFPNS